MQPEKIHTVFWHISRISIILPIVIIAIALVLRFDEYKRARKYPKPAKLVATSSATIAPSSVPVAKRTTTIDLNKKQKCSFSNDQGDLGEAFIAGEKMYGSFLSAQTGVRTKVLLEGDCVYKWQEFSTIGNQICGVSEYLNLLRTFSSMGLLDVESLIDIVVRFSNDDTLLNQISTLSPVCIEQQIPDTVFAVDEGVTFTKTFIEKPSL